MIETGYFKIKPNAYVRRRLSAWAWRWWWAVLTPLLILAVLSVNDIRFLIAGLALIFIAYPGLMMLVYFNHALSPEVAAAVVPHRVKISSDNIIIEYKAEEGHPTPDTRTIPKDEILRAEDTGSTILLHLKGKRYDFIEIPVTAFFGNSVSEALRILGHKSTLA